MQWASSDRGGVGSAGWLAGCCGLASARVDSIRSIVGRVGGGVRLVWVQTPVRECVLLLLLCFRCAGGWLRAAGGRSGCSASGLISRRQPGSRGRRAKLAKKRKEKKRRGERKKQKSNAPRSPPASQWSIRRDGVASIDAQKKRRKKKPRKRSTLGGPVPSTGLALCFRFFFFVHFRPRLTPPLPNPITKPTRDRPSTRLLSQLICRSDLQLRQPAVRLTSSLQQTLARPFSLPLFPSLSPAMSINAIVRIKKVRKRDMDVACRGAEGCSCGQRSGMAPFRSTDLSQSVSGFADCIAAPRFGFVLPLCLFAGVSRGSRVAGRQRRVGRVGGRVVHALEGKSARTGGNALRRRTIRRRHSGDNTRTGDGVGGSAHDQGSM